MIGYYFAIVTMITVGYGDITPISEAARLFTIITMLISTLFFSYILTKLSNVF